MIRRLHLIGLVSSLLSFTGAFAETSSSSSVFSDFRWEPYIQGAVTSTLIDSPSNAVGGLDLGGSSRGNSYRTTLGFQLNDYFGVEGTWLQLPNLTVSSKGGDAKYSGYAYFAQLTAGRDLTENISAVARIGAGRSDVKVDVPSASYSSSSNRNLLVTGLGLRLKILKTLDLTIDHDNLGNVGKYNSADSVKASLFSFGFKYKF